ncbi:MAG TPA: glycosyltransferase family 39 protein [Ktedonobacteraceae bacterium]|nr:glycosyltransferase family 39 protein [Ktedonobacteraceae bacterium]
MQTNTNLEPVAIDIQADRAAQAIATLKYTRRSLFLPFALFFAMIGAIFLLDAVLPLEGLWFHNVLLTQVGPWFQWPATLLFPGWNVTAPLPYANPDYSPPIALGWEQIPFLLAAFLAVFLVYLLAIRRLPRHVTYRYILISTVIFGIMYILIPVATSPDLFSYIGYARMGIIYHLNPLTTLPTAISNDPSFLHIYWTDQPSAYGPTWAFISSFLQLVTLPFGKQSLLPMVMALRLLGLAMHLCSTALIWSISGYLQRIDGRISLHRRKLATLAFAWNPLLLIEACTNAHNDATLLVFILLALWFLVRAAQNGEYANMRRGLVPAVIMLALATCLKINTALLVPGLLFLLWNQQPRRLRPIIYAILLYGGIILLLYAPFWQNGTILAVVRDNPTSHRNINSLPEFVTALFNGISGLFGFSSPLVENLTHLFSLGIFVILYAWLCWHSIHQPAIKLQNVPDLVRWMALIWLLYCFVGAPWFWPWYLVTFFGLYALVESTPSPVSSQGKLFFRFLSVQSVQRIPLAVRLLAFSMLSINCFYIWGIHSSYIPGLSDFSWSFLRGPWAWALPLLAFYPYLSRKIAQRYHTQNITAPE